MKEEDKCLVVLQQNGETQTTYIKNVYFHLGRDIFLRLSKKLLEGIYDILVDVLTT